MSDLKKFISETLDEHKEELKKLEEFQSFLKLTQKKKRTSYPTYDVISTT